MYNNNYISPERRNKINKFAKGLLIFHAIFAILFFITFKLPIIPNGWLVDNIGKVTCAILSSILFYFLLFCKGESGKIILIEGLKYKCNSFAQRIKLCAGILFFCWMFYFLGQLLVPILISPVTFINGEHEIFQAKLVNRFKGERWYRGHTKLVFLSSKDHQKIAFYWPTNEAQQLIQGRVLNITTNKMWLGTYIKAIKKAD